MTPLRRFLVPASVLTVFTTLLVLAMTTSWADGPGEPGRAVLVIHGGAGAPENLPEDAQKEYRAALELALREGYKALQAPGGKAINGVEAAIKVLEDSPLFNAGKGAVFTHDGNHRLDASIMDGQTRMAGAVAGVGVLKNPIAAARLVMEKSEHVLLTGRGAEEFALRHGLEEVPNSYFSTEKRKRQLEEVLAEESKQGERGTVGAVALDRHGHLAAGTSTGGMVNVRHGRVGDSPIIGAGTYADENCGVSCTGHGEIFIRYAVAHDVAARVRYQKTSLGQAAQAVLDGLPPEDGGVGGLIALDHRGQVAMPFNTPGMFRGYITAGGKTWVGIYGGE